jgi:diaminopimelate decarboxylase
MPVVWTESGRLELGGVDLERLARDPEVGTPTYVYDLSAMVQEVGRLRAAFESAPHLVAYAVKANSAGPVVRALAGAGCGADVVSGAELDLALQCGVPPERILFSGVAKRDDEIDQALHVGVDGIGAIQVESIEELARVSARAKGGGRRARISLRVNPEASVEALGTHSHIATGHDEAKFGIPRDDVAAALELALADRHICLAGLSAHIGSQLTRTSAYLEAAQMLFELAEGLQGRPGSELKFVDTGGGFGIDYGDGCDASPARFVRETRLLMRQAGALGLAHYVEPGRSLVAAHAVLLATTIQHKATPYRPDAPLSLARRRWLMIDAGMNDLLRPALYQARHRVTELTRQPGERIPYRVVGPVCESSDDFGVHELPVAPPAHVAILDAGAYGYTMSSRYNGRALPAELFIDGGDVVMVRKRSEPREWVDDRLAAERR